MSGWRRDFQHRGGVSNQVNVLNGGVLSNVTGLLDVGSGETATGSGYNSLIVTGGGSGLFMTGAGGINVGIGANNNTVILFQHRACRRGHHPVRPGPTTP